MTPFTAAPDRALLFAALSGPFIPEQALQEIGAAGNVDALSMAASYLADVCDIHPAGKGGSWLMRTPFRHSLLRSLDEAQLASAIAARRKANPDNETSDLLGVLLDQSPLDRSTIQTALQAPIDTTTLKRAIVALDRAGELAPARDLLTLARSALSEAKRDQRRQLVSERGFYGRHKELAKIEDWLAKPASTTPVSCLFITGAPGIGKSSLLAEAVRLAHERHRPLLLRLDFDRAGLDVQDSLGLTQEAARQLAEQLGEAGRALLQARLEAGRVEESDRFKQSYSRQRFPVRLADRIGSAIRASNRVVLVVLDTLEVLRGRGETHPVSLFAWLDSLVRHGVNPMVILAAGRGDALDSLRAAEQKLFSKQKVKTRSASRVNELAMDRLDEPAAHALLDRMNVSVQDRAQLLQIGDGSPLKLRLAAEIVRRSNLENLPKRRRGSEVSAAFLYRLLLSRIEDATLRALAHPGLIVRRINAEVIQQVLSPALGLKALTAEHARKLLDQLASLHWLVEPDLDAPGFLKHRSDMRRLLLPLLYQSASVRSARVDAAAVRWFGARSEAWAQVEAVYHQLQLTRNGRTVPTVSGQIAAQFDDDALDELPTRAADIVRRTRGQRTNQFREMMTSDELKHDDKLLEDELLSLARKQDWKEGAFIVRNVLAQGRIDPRSPAADAMRTFLWRSGQWAEARRWLNERDVFDSSDKDLPNLPTAIAMARLEMRAEFAPEELRQCSSVWQPLLKQLYRSGEIATGSDARQGALALIFRSLPDSKPDTLPRLRERDYSEGAAIAAFDHWGRVPASNAVQETVERAKRYLADSGISPSQLMDGMPFGTTLASLTPYAGFVTNHIIARQRQDIQELAQTAVTVLSREGWILHPGLRFDRTPDSDPFAWLTNAGLFSEWLQAAAFVLQDTDLALIARSAERWRRTVAGDWSYGRRRSHWRSHPVLDETLMDRLQVLESAVDPRVMAIQQINLWGAALSCPRWEQLLQRRLREAVQMARTSVSSGTPLDQITRRLLAHGAPAAVAPALAVLNAYRVF